MITEKEKKAFMTDGFIVRTLDFEDGDLEGAVDLVWRNIDSKFIRDVPSSWKGDVSDCCRVAGIAKRRGRVKLRNCVQHEPLLSSIIFKNKQINQIIYSLLGPKAIPRKKIRGLYPIFPSPTSSNRLDGGMDAHPFQVGCIIYLSDVNEDGGAFNIWKGSHHIMKDAFPTKASWDLQENVKELGRLSQEKCERVSISGKKGTVIFWHHRLLHTPGTNRTTKVRHALLADFVQEDWESKVDEPHEDDMWSDWALESQRKNSFMSKVFEKLGYLNQKKKNAHS